MSILSSRRRKKILRQPSIRKDNNEKCSPLNGSAWLAIKFIHFTTDEYHDFDGVRWVAKANYTWSIFCFHGISHLCLCCHSKQLPCNRFISIFLIMTTHTQIKTTFFPSLMWICCQGDERMFNYALIEMLLFSSSRLATFLFLLYTQFKKNFIMRSNKWEIFKKIRKSVQKQMRLLKLALNKYNGKLDCINRNLGIFQLHNFNHFSL